MPVLEELLPKALAVVCAKGQSPDLWASVLDPFMAAGGITTPWRIAGFIGQVAVESEGFTKLEEDLSYSAERLLAVWPSRFAGPYASMPRALAHKPRGTANWVYAHILGNGGPITDDGWRFRGSGLIQLTGRDNQTAFAKDAKVDPATVGDYLRTSKGAAQSACWYWARRELNPLADAWLLTRMSVAINGSTEGLDRRIELCNRVRKAVGA